MTSNQPDRQQDNNNLLSKPPKTNHRKILDDLLNTVQKQEEVMRHLLRDVEFFRKTFKTSLQYDSGAGDYREETADGTEFDIRSSTDAGDGMIKEETAVDYIGYSIAMDNFQLGFNRTKERIEEMWKDADVGRGSLAMPKAFADSLEKGRKVAAQEL
ncbi:hypothetical protein N0V94_007549 [Neodidymelliopsis sp. IMI 364377]|nr:hypothetical protein N0V94_007549 [Neodidymelliopsis sp. IMI 364377]